MQSSKRGLRGRSYKFFRWVISYTSFHAHFKNLFDMKMDGGFGLSELNDMAIYEFEIYKFMTEQKLKEEEKILVAQNKQKNRRFK